MSDPVAKSKRLGGMVFMIIAIIAPNIGMDFGTEDAEKATMAWDTMLSAISGFVGTVLILWSKAKDVLGR